MSPLDLLAVLVGVLGLAVGSFLNVVIHRVPRRESVISPPSHCPRCAAPILNRHNVPLLGWLVLRGRCHGCALPISVRYPLVEGATGALFAGLTLALGVTPVLPVALALGAGAITLGMIAFDAWRQRRAAGREHAATSSTTAVAPATGAPAVLPPA